MNPGIMVVAIIGGIAGGLSTLYLAISFPGIILWKLYRKVVHHIPMTKWRFLTEKLFFNFSFCKCVFKIRADRFLIHPVLCCLLYSLCILNFLLFSMFVAVLFLFDFFLFALFLFDFFFLLFLLSLCFHSCIFFMRTFCKKITRPGR